jgi:thioredoxin 1
MKKIIYFSAPWCGPCKVLGPTIERLTGELPITKVNVDEDNTISAKYGIRNIPTLVLIDQNGKEINRIVGNISEQQIKQFYNG